MHINTSEHLPTWPAALKDKLFRRKLLISIFFLVDVLIIFFFVLQYAEKRDGFVIEKNWLSEIISPRDFSSWIFPFMYGATLIGVVFCFQKPSTTLLLIRTYLLLQFFRAITLLIIPLNPSEEIIPLNDPFLQATFYDGRSNLKDLFFSGHVATLVMFIPIISNKWIKWVILLAAIVVGFLLIAQRVHYIVDVVAAPVFAVIAVQLAKRWTKL